MKSGRVVPAIIIAGAAVVLVAVSLLSGAAAPAGSQQTDTRATTFSAAPMGTRALFLVMDHFMPGVGRLVKPAPSLSAPGGTAPSTLLVMQPTTPLGPGEEPALDAWVSAGGQLIIATSVPWLVDSGNEGEDFLSRNGFKLGSESSDEVTYTGMGGTLLLGAVHLAPGQVVPLFDAPGGPVVGEKPIGKGRIIVITDGYAWSNARLARSENAAWLVATVAAWDNGRLLVDEFHQGIQGGAGSLALIIRFLGSYWGIAVLQLAAAAALYSLGRAWRFGPARDLPPERIQDPLARIRGIASFLQAAEARAFSSQAVTQLAAARRKKGAHA